MIITELYFSKGMPSVSGHFLNNFDAKNCYECKWRNNPHGQGKKLLEIARIGKCEIADVGNRTRYCESNMLKAHAKKAIYAVSSRFFNSVVYSASVRFLFRRSKTLHRRYLRCYT